MTNERSLFHTGANHPIRTYFGRSQPAAETVIWFSREDAYQFLSFYVCCFVATMLYIV